MKDDSVLQKRYNHFHYIVLQSAQRGLDDVASGLVINRQAAVIQLLSVLADGDLVDNNSLHSLTPEE